MCRPEYHTMAIDAIKNRLTELNYKSYGMCWAASVIVGAWLAMDPNRMVDLVSGSVRGRPHWWIICDNMIVDATAEQFDPVPTTDEYMQVDSFRDMNNIGELVSALFLSKDPT
jgi:hypothetical protein